MTTSQETHDSSGIGGRVRNSLALARTRVEEIEQRTRDQWVNIPNQVRAAMDGLMVRVRKTLDLPSRGEIADLIARIEDMDAKLAELESARAKAAATAEQEPKAKAEPAAKKKKKSVPATGKKTAKKATAKATAAKSGTADKSLRKQKIAQAAKKAKTRKAKS